MRFLPFSTPPGPLSAAKKRREEGEKIFFSEKTVSGGTYVPPDTVFSDSFKVPALEGGDLGVGDNYFIEKLF